MDWITIEEVKEAASKGLKEALKSSQKHWKQLATATVIELINRKLVESCIECSIIYSKYCALCIRDEMNCSLCIAKKEDSIFSSNCCNDLWSKTISLWNIENIKDRTFTKAAKKVSEFLDNIKLKD